MARGQLRVYLGAAPGVGKTYKMLEEGRRRAARGTDVVVGLVETHDRPATAALLEGMTVVPRRQVRYRDTTFTEMDLDAILRRAPAVALVDELAHTNVAGSRNTKRWQDIEELLAAGITVLTTVNIQHLESLADVVAEITGVAQRELVPDGVVRQADQVELVDMTPEALRRRLSHGNVYQPEKVDAALENYFRVGNLTALRELGLLWLADKVDEQLDRYRADHDIAATWETRERVVVALSGGSEGDTLIRRAARIAARSRGADLIALHVASADGLAGSDPAQLARQRVLVESLGGTYHQVRGSDVPESLLEFARAVNATQLVLGASRRGHVSQLFGRGVANTIATESGSIDVHLVSHEHVGHGRRARHVRGVTRGRRVTGFLVGAVGLLMLSVGLHFVPSVGLNTDILLFLTLVVAVAIVGGLYPALTTAVAGFGLLNYYFTPPLYRFTIAERQNLLALVVFLLVAVAVSAVVDLAARRTAEAARSRAEAETLATVAGGVLRGGNLSSLLEQLRETFAWSSVSLLERRADTAMTPDLTHDLAAWNLVTSTGPDPCTTPGQGDVTVPVDDRLTLAMRGPTLPAGERRVVEAFAAQAAIALRQQRLAAQAAAAAEATAADQMRSALLSAVSHDLRAPLAAATTAINSLRRTDVGLTDADEADLLAAAEESLLHLRRLVENLLDMSRLQAGALGMQLEPISIAEILPIVVDELEGPGNAIEIRAADDISEVRVDPILLERILVNLLANALRHSPDDAPPALTVTDDGEAVQVRVTDHGPGIPASEREQIFLPFQRRGDHDNTTGLGLGLALSRGLTEAMGGTLVPEQTPGGGLTMVLSFPTAPSNQLADPAILERLQRYPRPAPSEPQ